MSPRAGRKTGPGDHEAELERIRREYEVELPAKLEAVREAVTAVRDSLRGRGRALPSEWRELEFLAHKLAGSAGTYGFDAVSKQARVMSEAVAAGKAAQLGALDADTFVRGWFARLEKAAASAGDGEAR